MSAGEINGFLASGTGRVNAGAVVSIQEDVNVGLTALAAVGGAGQNIGDAAFFCKNDAFTALLGDTLEQGFGSNVADE